MSEVIDPINTPKLYCKDCQHYKDNYCHLKQIEKHSSDFCNDWSVRLCIMCIHNEKSFCFIKDKNVANDECCSEWSKNDNFISNLIDTRTK